MEDTKPEMRPESHTRLTLIQMICSVLASFFGVQSSRNRKRDFRHGSAGKFITVACIMTAVWYLAIYGIVKIVLGLAVQ